MILLGRLRKLCWFFSKKVLVFVSLLFLVVVLFVASFVSVVNGASSGVSDVVVGDEVGLLNAVGVAPNKVSYVIGLSGDIVLRDSLEIPKGKNIVLVVSEGVLSGFACLVGGDGVDTIVVKGVGH